MLNNPILAILRGVSQQELEKLTQVFLKTGIDSLEITMNTPNCENLVSYAKKIGGNNLSVGAGTVLTIQQLEKIIYAGAEFIVTPVVNTAVIKECVDQNIPVLPGALTPTEIWQAWDMGATMVKVFPANAFGPKYFKNVLGPLNNVKLMAVGGVNVSNMKDYFNAGAKAVAIGGSLMSQERMDNNQYDLIESDLLKMMEQIPEHLL